MPLFSERPSPSCRIAALVQRPSQDGVHQPDALPAAGLGETEAPPGFAAQVHRVLWQLGDAGAGMKTVATVLNMSERSLRRHLADEGTCFSTISHQVRYSVAAQQLEGSQASVEQIAASAGFSDAANFRRAFIRWTSMSPAQFRQRLHVAGPQAVEPEAAEPKAAEQAMPAAAAELALPGRWRRPLGGYRPVTRSETGQTGEVSSSCS